jgi:UDP-glucuronate decarboxylase
MKTCLVTGAAGFVGSHLCDRLLKDGYKVIGVDNLYTGSLKNLAECVVNKQFDFHHLDVSDEKFFQFFRLSKLDYIFNLACPASPVHYQRDPVYTFMTNILGAKNVLDLARLTGARVVQASTSEIYGDPLIHPQQESYYGNVNTLGPRACYDEGKRGAETLFSDYRRKYEVNAGIFRIFNTYGPRMAKDDGRVVSNFIVAALADAELIIHGAGAQTRSFQYIDDLIEGIVRFAFSSETGPINLGNPGEFTVDELASIVIKKLNKGYKVYVERTIDDPQQRKPDITLAKDKLNWEPKIALSGGLDKTIEYFRGV